ncbi:MAG: efflux RND transporter periplasmic adaptor subunit [Ktedonobacteraceae bacterium]|nr:efflux RND transporter periplasmic adaptor subunit [Ktedonobacteraceae bacterium]
MDTQQFNAQEGEATEKRRIVTAGEEARQQTEKQGAPVIRELPAGNRWHWPQGWQDIKRIVLSARKRLPRWLWHRLVLAGLLVACIGLIAGGSFVWQYWFAVNTVTVFRVGAVQAVEHDIGGGGIVYPRQRADVSYPLSERVISVLVRAGERVKVNQPLLKLDPAQLNAQIAQAASDVAAARDYLNSVSGVGNATTVAQAQQQYQLAQSRYNTIVTQASSFNNGVVTSPLDGVVTAINVNAGELFPAQQTMLTIMDLSAVIVRAKVPVQSLHDVRAGMPAVVTPSALPDVDVRGRVITVVPQADVQTDTFEVWIELANAQQVVLPGMGAFVRIQAQVPGVVVPASAVSDKDGGAVVFVVSGGRAVARHVHVIGRSADRVAVDRGLAPGERVVVTARGSLRDGQQVVVRRG